MADIRIEHLRKQFGSFVAVQDSSFVIHAAGLRSGEC